MVKRYDADHEGVETDGYESVVLRDDGAFVTYEDYAALEEKYLNLCRAIKEASVILNMPEVEDC